MTVHATIAGVTRGSATGIDFLRRAGREKSRPLVLLHGIGSNASSFTPLMNALPPDIDAFAWDAPGYMGSRALAPASPTPRDYAAAAITLLDALSLDRVILVGHSLGSLFAACVAAYYPQRIASLALLSPAIGYRVASGAALPPAVQSRIDDLATLGPVAFAAKRAARLVGDPKAQTDVVASVEQVMASVNPGGYAQAVRALDAGDLIADAARIAVPTVVAVGSSDVITPPDNARAVHAALRGTASFHEFPGAGHALPQEQPLAVARLLARLVEEHADV